MRIRSVVPLVWLTCAAAASGQLIPAGTPIPKTPKPPVVFLNGYQTACPASRLFSDSFGKFDQYLQATNRVTLFFDNCTIAGKPAIEELGNGFATFLSKLTYTDGTPVTQVDIVAHSLGGLIVRSYLAGMQTNGSFQPPANPPIRKIVFLSTPHFGSDVALIFALDTQTQELATASSFVFNLATWNQGTDDLRGVDVLEATGDKGVNTINGNADSDGVSSFNSSSLAFARPGRTRVIPYCHISYSDLVALAGPLAAFVCQSGSPGIAQAVLPSDANVQLVQSFLNDTPDWQNIGQAAEQNPVFMTQAGVILRAKTAADQFVTLQEASIGTTNLNIPATGLTPNSVAYKEFLTPGSATANVKTGVDVQQQQVSLGKGYTTAVTVKAGPLVSRVLPAAALVSPLAIAPGTFVAIYGNGFATSLTTATSTPFPTTLGGTQVLVNGTAIPLYFVAANQIDAVFPAGVSGLVNVTVTNATGQSTVRVLMAPSVPAIFTQDSSGSGPASALNAVTGALVSSAAPLKAGEYVSLYLTGLGAKTAINGFQVANVLPVVTIGGKPCPVQFAGATPIYAGLDQINCQVPDGLGSNPAAPVVVTAGGRTANTVTIAVQ